MRTIRNYIGRRFNMLTVLSDAEDKQCPAGPKRAVICKCDCGTICTKTVSSLTRDNVKSCGCQSREATSRTMTKHGLTKNPLDKKIYAAWRDIKVRCYDTEHEEYKRYGALGICLQDTWKEDVVSFHQYVKNLPNFSKDRSIDRIDNDLGYCEGNLRWATDGEQTRNQSKQENNTSGYCGVTWYYNDTGGTRAIAWWTEEGKTKSKSFPVKKFGVLPAFLKACNHREQMILKLNRQGYGYSDKHGK